MHRQHAGAPVEMTEVLTRSAALNIYSHNNAQFCAACGPWHYAT